MLSVYFDTTPLQSGHATRGIGAYTRNLLAELKNVKNITVTTEPITGKTAEIVHYPFFDIFFPTLPITLRKKTVVTIHDVIPLEFPEFYKPGIRGTLASLRQRLALRFTQAVITDSEYSKQKIHSLLGIPQEKIFVTYLAPNPELTEQPKDIVKAARAELNLPKDYILYVGDINYNKNIPQLIKCLKFLPDEVELVCVGKNFVEQSIPEWQWIDSQLALSDVSKRVKFVTNIGVEDTKLLGAVFTGALAYVQPSFSEGFGLPILEAMQCGCPVISSTGGSLPEVGGDVPLYVAPEAEAIARAVDNVLAWSSKNREAAINRGKAWAQQFSWAKTAERTMSVYELIAQESQQQ
jgi:glycosyltransferase involved in cell wall biosynthesis